MKIKSWTTAILWIVYLFLLIVLLPHTAWAFRAFEPDHSWTIYGDFTSADLVSYVGALAFESAIAVLTHKLSTHIEQTEKAARKLGEAARLWLRYGNAYFLGLLISTVVSSLANLAHAIEFGSRLKIFAEWNIPSEIYSVAFGAILPFVSLLFARVLSEVNESESEEDPAVAEIRTTLGEVRSKMREAEARARSAEQSRTDAEARAKLAEDRFGAAGDLMRALLADDKRERILAVRKQWPALPGSAIAVMVDASPSYVSEVVKTERMVE